MNSPLAQNTAKSAKDLAKQIAKQMAQEPLEVLKEVKTQVGGEETLKQPDNRTQGPENPQKPAEHQQKLQDAARSSRQVEALNREIEDIRKQKLFKDLQEKIAQGVIVPIEDYTELSMEQKQVLKAQMEAVKIQNANLKTQSLQEAPTIHSKPSRRFGAGQKQEAEKQQTRVEKPVPPSG